MGNRVKRASRPPPIATRPDPGLIADKARDIRARAWGYVFACFERHRNEKPVKPDRDTGDDAKEIKDEFRATDRMPR